MALLCALSENAKSRRKPNLIFDSRTGHHTTILLNGFTEPFGSVSFYTDFGLGVYLVFIAKQQGSRCCSKSLISLTAEVLILNLWSLSREFGFFAALLFFFVKDKCVGDCPARPCLCFLEHKTVDVRCRWSLLVSQIPRYCNHINARIDEQACV